MKRGCFSRCLAPANLELNVSLPLTVARWRSWLRHCATSRKVAGSIPDGVGIFLLHNGPGVDTVSDRSEYQEYFLELKAADA
jgi:hypothetical protein